MSNWWNEFIKSLSDAGKMGTVLLGITALITLWQTNGIINEILVVQQQAKEINYLVRNMDAYLKVMPHISQPYTSQPFSLNEKNIDSILSTYPDSPQGLATGKFYISKDKAKKELQNSTSGADAINKLTNLLQIK